MKEACWSGRDWISLIECCEEKKRERVVSESEVWCRSNPRQHGDIMVQIKSSSAWGYNFFLPLKRNGQPVKIISEIDYRETWGYFKA